MGAPRSWMRDGARVATIRRVPIVIHPSWVVSVTILSAFVTGPVAADLGGGLRGPGLVLVAILAVLPIAFSIVLHELAHALTARRLGLRVDRITLFAFGGVSVIAGRTRTPSAEYAVAASGPILSLILAGTLASLSRAIEADGHGLSGIAGVYALVNLLLALFNLIPAFPMDGGRVLRALIWRVGGSRARATTWAARTGRVFAGLLVLLGLYALIAPLTRSSSPDAGGLWTAAIGLFIYISAEEAERVEGGDAEENEE